MSKDNVVSYSVKTRKEVDEQGSVEIVEIVDLVYNLNVNITHEMPLEDKLEAIEKAHEALNDFKKQLVK